MYCIHDEVPDCANALEMQVLQENSSCRRTLRRNCSTAASEWRDDSAPIAGRARRTVNSETNVVRR
jgi:hypothetical protein